MSRPSRTLGYDAFEHPTSIAEVQALVQRAIASGAQVRVRGSLHSEEGSVLGDGYSRTGAPRKVHQLMLDKLTSVTIERDSNHQPTGRVIAQAGVSLGGDPLVPGEHNAQHDHGVSLFKLLHDAGLAPPVTGGISHQTISGFLSTGSAGGSTLHCFQDAIAAITLVDGHGQLRTLRRGDPELMAAMVSLGVLGVIVEVELQCSTPAYDVLGLRSTQAVCDCDIDLFAPVNDPRSLARYLTQKEYTRLMWWPQPGVDRVELWECKRVPLNSTQPRPPAQAAGVIHHGVQLAARALLAVVIESLIPNAGEGASNKPRGLAKLIETLTFPLRFAYHFVDAIVDAVAPWSETQVPWSLWKQAFSPSKKPAPVWMPATIDAATQGKPKCKPARASRGMTEGLIARVLNGFVKTSPYAQAPWTDDDGWTRRYAAERFCDPWYQGLPMDNPIHDRGLPVTFTEVWVPMRYAQAAMIALRDRFQRDGFAATGTFCIELYSARRSDAWISPAYGEDVFRIDPFWFDDGDDEARHAFFTQFWELLAPFEPRQHWGKALSPPGSSTGAQQRHQVLPKLADFLALRTQYDPNDTFLTEYWKRHLGIA